MLSVNNVEVFFVNVIQVLRGVSLEVPDGKIVALLGANGAGKTTTVKAITGVLEVEEGEITSGSIEYDGERIDKMSTEKIVREKGIVMVWEGRRILEHLNVEENLLIGAYATPFPDRKKKEQLEIVYDYFPRLREIRRRTAGYLSGGEQQMAVIGSAMMAQPRIMLLDEPSLGLAPLLVKGIFEIINIKINKEQHITILLVEQNANMALSMADYGYVIENGKIVLDGPVDKLKNNEDIKEFYLGLSEVGKKKSYREIKHYRRRKRWL